MSCLSEQEVRPLTRRSAAEAFTGLVAGVLLFLAIAVYNGYPLVNSDTGAYILNMFSLYVPKDRPLTYSFFLLLTALGRYLWGVVLVQALLASWLVNRCISLVPGRKISLAVRLLLLVLLASGSSVAWYCGQLMPDIFTAFTALGLLLYLYSPSPGERRLLLFFLFGSILMHHSNLLTATLFCGLLLSGSLLCRTLYRYRRRHLYLVSLVGACWLAACTINLVAGRGFRPSESGHVFQMGRLAENGVLKSYLEVHCASGNNSNPLCRWKDRLPMPAAHFIWAEDGPFLHTGGWDSAAAVYNPVIRDILCDPAYLFPLLAVNGRDALRQLLLLNTMNGIYPFREDSSPYLRISSLLPASLPAYTAARQYQDTLGIGDTATYYRVWLLLLLLAAVLISCYRPQRSLLCFGGGCMLFLLLNAWVTVSFANVLDRLNARTIWILPLACLMIIAAAWPQRRNAAD